MKTYFITSLIMNLILSAASYLYLKKMEVRIGDRIEDSKKEVLMDVGQQAFDTMQEYRQATLMLQDSLESVNKEYETGYRVMDERVSKLELLSKKGKNK